jgi:hypothetical protein
MEKLGNTKLKALDKIFWSDKRQIIFAIFDFITMVKLIFRTNTEFSPKSLSAGLAH